MGIAKAGRALFRACGPTVALEADDGADNNVGGDDDGDDSDGDLMALGHDTDDDDDDGNMQLQGHGGSIQSW